MNTIQIIIEAGEVQQEILISELAELGASGFEQLPGQLLAYFPEPGFEEELLAQVVRPYAYEKEIVAERNWNEEWEQNFQPITVDDFCAIRASFHQPVIGVEQEIIITPKMSFGTGHHATTYMMLQGMRGIDFSNRSVFDFGTGTGVLAILAEKLGAADVTAIDVDEWSMENAAENLAANGCNRIQLIKTSTVPNVQFDVILANINRNVILENMEALINAAKPGAAVLFSGLLSTDEADIVKAAATAGLRLVKQNSRANWVCLLFTR